MARRDERRRGFDKTRPAPGAPAVMAKYPGARPLYHEITVDGVRLQSYRRGIHDCPMISDDGRIEIYERGDFWTAEIAGVQVIMCGLIQRFETPEEAVLAALATIKTNV